MFARGPEGSGLLGIVYGYRPSLLIRLLIAQASDRGRNSHRHRPLLRSVSGTGDLVRIVLVHALSYLLSLIVNTQTHTLLGSLNEFGIRAVCVSRI